MRSFSLKALAYTVSPSVLHPLIKRIEASDLGMRLARGVFWSMAGAIISRALMLLATMLIARLLGKTGYGELGMIQSTVGMFGVFAGFGLGLTATKYVAEFRHSDPARVSRILGLSTLVACCTGGLMALGLLIFSPWLAEHTINAPHLTNQLRIGAVILFLSALNGAQTGALSGFEAFRVIARVNFLVGVVSFPLLLFGTFYGGLTGAVWALALNLSSNWLLNHLALRREATRYNISFTFRKCFEEWAVLWRFSLPAALSGVVFGPVKWVCGAILVNQSGGYGEMGMLNAANQWSTAILFLPGLLAQVVLPLLSGLNGESRSRQYSQILRTNVLLNGCMAAIIVTPVVIFAPQIMSAYGANFEQGANVLRVMAVTAIFVAVNSVVGSSIASKGKMWIGFAFNSMWACILLGATFLFVKNGYGALGVGLATLVSYLAHTVWQFAYVSKIIFINNFKSNNV